MNVPWEDKLDPLRELAQANVELCQAITDGTFDRYLPILADAVSERQRTLRGTPAGGSFRQQSRAVSGTFRKGDRVRVRIDSGLRPTYVLGLTGVVDHVNQMSVAVTWDPDQYIGRFARNGTHPTKVPAAGLEHIEEATQP